MEVEGLLIHGAAHLFFEHKLEDLTAEFNGKIKKMEAFIKRELYKLHDLHMGEVKKIKSEVVMLKEEVQDVKKMRREVMQVKEFLSDKKHHEEDITHLGIQQITKINKEMKSEVKHLKSQVKSLKNELISTKGTSRTRVDHQETSDLRLNTLELKKEDVEELLTVRRAIQRAFERAVNPAVPAPNDTPANIIDSDSGRSSLHLWLPSPGPPCATAGDAIQLSQSVILYLKAPEVKALEVTTSDSSNIESLHWSSEEDLSAPVTRNFDVGAVRRQSPSKQTSDDESDHPHHHHHHVSHHLHHNKDDHPHHHHLSHHPLHDEEGHHHHLLNDHHNEDGHVNQHLHHSHLASALHRARQDSPPLTPVLSGDEVANHSTGATTNMDSLERKENTEDMNAGITMKIDRLEEEKKVEKSETEIFVVVEFVNEDRKIKVESNDTKVYLGAEVEEETKQQDTKEEEGRKEDEET